MNKNLIHNRCKAGHNGTLQKRGRRSPLHQVEPYIAILVKMRARMNKPLSIQETILLAQSVIDGTIHIEKYNSYCLEMKQKPGLGYGWWKGFKARYPDIIATKLVIFDRKEDEWLSYGHMETMYNDIYKHMVEAGVARKVDNPVYFNVNNEMVDEDDPSRFPISTNYIVTKPELIIFMDETGKNTNMKKDARIGNEKHVTAKGKRPYKTCSAGDIHFTTLPFITAAGTPVCCVIIIARKTLTPEVITGFQPWMKIGKENDDDFISKNANGTDKMYPFGPTCKYMNQDIPALVACNESGTVTSPILVQALTHIDKYAPLHRTPTSNRFLLVDGHDTRFQQDFLDYVNNDVSRWFCCIGLPYNTKLWQVGDAEQINGKFSAEITRTKRELIKTKIEF